MGGEGHTVWFSIGCGCRGLTCVGLIGGSWRAVRCGAYGGCRGVAGVDVLGG